MSDNELLSALSDMMDTKLKPIKDDIKILQDDMKIVKGEIKSMKLDIKVLQDDMITVKADIKSLQDDMITVKADIKSMEVDIKGLKDDMKHADEKLNKICIMHEHNIIPRLQGIEECYLSTYKRYVDTTEKMEKKMEMFDVVWITVEGHSEQILELEKLQKTS